MSAPDQTSAHPIYGTALYVDFLTGSSVNSCETPLDSYLIAKFDKFLDVMIVPRIVFARTNHPSGSHHLLAGESPAIAPEIDNDIFSEVAPKTLRDALSPCLKIFLDETAELT